MSGLDQAVVNQAAAAGGVGLRCTSANGAAVAMVCCIGAVSSTSS